MFVTFAPISLFNNSPKLEFKKTTYYDVALNFRLQTYPSPVQYAFLQSHPNRMAFNHVLRLKPADILLPLIKKQSVIFPH